MSSSEESIATKVLKRKKSSKSVANKKKPCGQNDVKSVNNNVDIPLTYEEACKKYANLSRTDLESLCERILIYDKTGVYVSPEEFKLNCKTKKSKQVGSKPREQNTKHVGSKCGKGRVGISHEKFGRKICTCCNQLASDRADCLNFASGNLSNGTQEVHVERVSDLDLSKPSCSRVSKQDSNADSVMDFVNDINNLMDQEFLQPEDPPRVDVSMSEQSNEQSSDVSVVGLTSNSVEILSEFLQVTSATNPRNVGSETQTEASTGSSVDIVDLTNCATPNINRRAYTNCTDVIELIDESPFRTNLIPGVVETIDLLDSESDSEKCSVMPEFQSPKPALECPICWESLKNKKAMSTICGHIFCEKCIKNVIKTRKGCPSCRKKLSRNSIHPIYFNYQ